MENTERMRVATRIHYALLRYMGSGIEVDSMLARADYAREVLYVCEGSGDAVLQQLGRLYRDAIATPTAAVPAAPQDTPWSGNTSGFGFTRPGDEDDGVHSRPTQPRGFSLARWWRRHDARR
jgi:hypothetical protein